MRERKHKGMAGWQVLAGICALAVAPWAAAQRPVIPVAAVAPAPEVPKEVAEELDELSEVVVTGERLYDRIVKAEDNFFALYNELNSEDDFDTNCASVPVEQDSRIEQRFCMPAFFADAKAEQVRLSQYCLSLRDNDEDGNLRSQGPCYEPPSAEQLFFARREEYVKQVLATINSNSSLKRMYAEVEMLHRERAMLSKRYDDIKAQRVSDQGEKNRNRTTVH